MSLNNMTVKAIAKQSHDSDQFQYTSANSVVCHVKDAVQNPKGSQLDI